MGKPPRTRKFWNTVGTLSLSAACSSAGVAQVMPPSGEYRRIGSVVPRSAIELKAAGLTSSLSIGAETTDRGYSTYANWKSYLGPLGISKARVQTGWVQIERVKGVYDYSLLDSIVTDMQAQGVQPWLNLSYGNKLYSGGGGETLKGGIPTGEDGAEGRAAWLRFVNSIVTRYNAPSRRVTEWEIWNEPDNGPNPPAPFATFAAETAREIKRVQPGAKIILAGFTSQALTGAGTPGLRYAETVITGFDRQKGPTVPDRDVTVTYHSYHPNPDTSYDKAFEDFKKVVYRAGFKVRQGENGAPSVNQPEFALANLPWNETSQAKYALRRILGDTYRGIETSLFSIVDMHYPYAKNTKGLLQTGIWDAADTVTPPLFGDQTVKRAKTGYRSVQTLTSIFDDRLVPVTAHGCTAPAGYTVQAWRRSDGADRGRGLLAVWRHTDRPGENEAPARIDVVCGNFKLGESSRAQDPRFVDLLSGNVYAPRKPDMVRTTGRGIRVTGLHAYDSPVLLADQNLVRSR